MEEALKSSWGRKIGTSSNNSDFDRIGKECANLSSGEHKVAKFVATKTAAERLRQLKLLVLNSTSVSADGVEEKRERLSSVSVTGGQASNHSKINQYKNINKRRGEEPLLLVNEQQQNSEQQPDSKEIKCKLGSSSSSEQVEVNSFSNQNSSTLNKTGATESNSLINYNEKKHAIRSSRHLNALIAGHKSWSEQRTIIVDIKNGRRVLDKSLVDPQNISIELQLQTTRGSIDDSLNPTLNSANIETVAAVEDQNNLNSTRQKKRDNYNEESSDQKSKTLAAKSSSNNTNKSSGGGGGGGKKASEETVRDSKRQSLDDKHSKESSKNGGATSLGAKQYQQHQQQDLQAVESGKFNDNNRDEEKRRQEEKERKAEARRVEEAKVNGKRPPTFGATPYKLTRLPYFSYYGKARNVDLISAADREIIKEKEDSKSEESSGNSSGTSSASSSQRSLNSLASNSRIPTLVSSRSSTLANQQKQQGNQLVDNGSTTNRRKFGYSNISNLFPGRPMSESRRGDSNARRQYSIRFGSEERDRSGTLSRSRKPQSASSVVNLNQQTNRGVKLSDDRNSRIATSAGRRNSVTHHSAYNLGGSAYAAARNRSLNSLNISPISQSSDHSGQHLQTAGMRRQNSASYNSKQRTLYQGRPSSVAGYMGRHHRSPSTSSLHYGSAGLSPYGPAPLPIDPDCPVHGYSPVNGTSAVQSKSSHNLAAPLEPVDLLYEPYPNYYERPVVRQGSLYSPTSPPLIDGSRTISKGRLPVAAHNGDAYYNSSSRFSMYHSPSVADGVRSSLAPPNEQLRRILGYQPHTRPIHLHPQWAYSRPFIHLQGTRSPSPNAPLDANGEPEIQPRFEPYNQLIDTQAIRAVDFHPSGEVYAIGSNSRALRICAYPADYELRHFGQEHVTSAPRILFKFLQVHRGSIYCVAFNSTGQLLATGSNDQTVHIVRYNSTTHSPDGDEYRLTMHDGTVRDICFIDDQTNGSSILLSAGGGDNKIYVTDCDTITPFQSMAGHTQMVMALHHWSGANFVSASQDKTIRFWDLRTRACTSIISAPPSGSGTTGASVGGGKLAGPGAPVCSVKVDPSGRLLASGHNDSTCMLYDIRGARIIQAFKPHDDEIRTVSFSPKSYYLLTGGYDGRIVLSDLQGDLTQPLPQCCVAESDDKIVQSKWHPSDFTFVTTSADKTATLWAMPTE